MSVAISGFAHVNLNCADLARSKRFYESALGLRALVHTDPAPQDCGAFGLTEPGQWDAWMLGHTEPGAGIALDLLEWLRPRPLAATDAPRRAPRTARAAASRPPDLASAAKRVTAAGDAPRGRRVGPDSPTRIRRAPLPGIRIGAPFWLRQADRGRIASSSSAAPGSTISALRRSARPGSDLCAEGARARAARPACSARSSGRTPRSCCRAMRAGFVALTAWQRPGATAIRSQSRTASVCSAWPSCAPTCPAPTPSCAASASRGLARRPRPRALRAPGCRALFFRDPDGACLRAHRGAPAASAPPPQRAHGAERAAALRLDERVARQVAACHALLEPAEADLAARQHRFRVRHASGPR
jgi:catechol 2,3-dioxygenase-like lactoylglutathione lyase family enzyme